MTEHILKTRSAYFDAVRDGRKTFEARVNDRCFQAGDRLVLVRNDRANQCAKPDCTCRPDVVERVVTFVYSGDPTLRDNGGLVPGHVILALAEPAGVSS